MSKQNEYYDVVVIGNGILGLSTAFSLQSKNQKLSLAVVGEDSHLAGATQASGAMLNCFNEATTQTFRSPFSRAKFAMAAESVKLWPAWLEHLNEGCSKKLAIRQGTHVVLNSRNGALDDENFHAIERALNEHKIAYQEVDPTAIAGLDPITDFRALRALFVPHEGAINPCRVMERLEQRLAKNKCRFTHSPAVKIKRQKNGLFSIRLADGMTICGEQVVIAAGAYSQQLIDQFGDLRAKIPFVLSSVGCSMLVRAPEIRLRSVVRTPGRSGACGFHMLAYEDGLIYAGATAFFSEHIETRTRMRYPYNLQKNLIHQFNHAFENAFIEKIIVGNRPVTMDTFPLIGKTSIPGLWLLTGTYRDGFHNAPLLGNYLAAEILGKSSFIENPFLPERRPLQLMSQKASIEETVKHMVAVNYEYGIVLPIVGVGFEENYIEGVTKKLTELYQFLKTDIALPVEMLVLLMRADHEKLLRFKKIYDIRC